MSDRVRRIAARLAAAGRLAVRDPRSFWMSVRMAVWLLLVTIVAPLVSLPTLFRIVETKQRWSPAKRLSAEELAQRIDRILHAGLVRDGSCWKRSAILRRYLLFSGIETDVVFGVRPPGGSRTLTGHAWLEHEGAPFLEREPPEYTVTFRYPVR